LFHVYICGHAVYRRSCLDGIVILLKVKIGGINIMQTRILIDILGWVTVTCFTIAILNFFVKYINKKYISKLGIEKKRLIGLYKMFMKKIIKYHKLAGTIAIISVLIHFFIAFLSNRISITGIIAALFMASILLLGVYGAFINKNRKGLWLKIHRIMAFGLLIAIVIHIIQK
jgi:hypothetical protein